MDKEVCYNERQEIVSAEGLIFEPNRHEIYPPLATRNYPCPSPWRA